MKRVAVLLALLMAMPPLDVLAQSASELKKPNTFTTEEACEAALQSGNFEPYEPKYFGLKTRNPVNDLDRVLVRLETDMCMRMHIVGARRWVVQKEGTPFRAYRRPEGLVLYARHDCGNEVDGVVLPAPPAPVARVEPERAPVPAPVVYGPPPPRDERVVHREEVRKIREVKEDDGSDWWKWALGAVGAGALGYLAYDYYKCPPGTKRR